MPLDIKQVKRNQKQLLHLDSYLLTLVSANLHLSNIDKKIV
jgi:hypothetical protein